MKKTVLIIALIITTNSVVSQTISGTIKDKQGQPIQNALVCHTNNPSIFTKTNGDGDFSIQGRSGTQLRIGALRYETLPDFNVNTPNNQSITLDDDPLLESDVFHISFDHIREGNTYTKNELKTDFNLAYSKGFYDGSSGSDRAAIDYNESVDPGGVSIRVRYPKNKLKTADSGIDTRIDLSGHFKNNDFKAEDLYLSYWIKFSDNFEFDKCGGKLPSLGGSTFNSTKDRWKGRIMWRKGGSIQFYMELPDNRFRPTDDERFWGERVKSGRGICNFEYTPYLKGSGWHNIELHYRFETPGRNDGIFEGWVDGENYDMMNASVFNNYRPSGTSRENITINTILLSAFLGGSDLDDYAPDEDIFTWFDEFRVSTKRINAWRMFGKQNTVKQKVLTTVKQLIATPNPSHSGMFKLSSSSTWEVYNILGVRVAKGEGKTVNLSAVPSGTYFLNTASASHIKLVKHAL